MATRYDVISIMSSSNFPMKLPVSYHIGKKKHRKCSKKQQIDKKTLVYLSVKILKSLLSGLTDFCNCQN